MKILIADDDTMLRRLFRLVLENAGYQVIECDNGKDAWVMVSQETPDAVILDQNMPEMTGIMVTEQLRRQGNTIPIIILTVDSSPQTIMATLDAGADSFMLKPIIAHEDLLNKLANVMRRRRAAHGSIAPEFNATLDVLSEVSLQADDNGRCLLCGGISSHADHCVMQRIDRLLLRFGGRRAA